MFDIAKDWKKTKKNWKKEKKQKNKTKMRKSQKATTSIFLLLFFYIEKFIFCLEKYLEKLSL